MRIALLICTVLVALAGCGKRGGLYLPEEPAATEVPAQPAPESTDPEDTRKK